jgi:predicted transcriptional regulator
MFELNEIKKLRKNLSLTQKDLALQAKVSQSLIAKIEAGKIDPTFSKATLIIDTLNNLSKDTKNAADILNKSIISVKSTDQLKNTILKMKKYNISQMPVIEDKKVVGLVSERIILEALINEQKPDVQISDVMNDAPPMITKDASLNIITNLLREYPIILVQEKGKLIGHITKSDILLKAFK